MNQPSDSVEFYLGDSQQPFLAIKSSFQPNDDDLINIRGETYKVLGRSFTIDHSDNMWERSIRCNVIVEKQTQAAKKAKEIMKRYRGTLRTLAK